jgi:phage-related protein
MIMAWFGNLGSTMKTQTDGPFAYLAAWFTENMPRIQKIVGDALAAISAFWTEYGDEIMAVVTWVFDFVQTNIIGSMETVMDIVQAILQIITGDFSGAGDTLGGIMDRWRERILGAWAAITTGIQDWWNNIDWGGLGKSMLDGIAAGITGAIGIAVQAMQDAGRAILDSIKGFFGIRSPSQVMADEVGKPLVEGLLGGFQQALGVAGQINGALFGGIGSFLGIQPGGGAVTITINNYGVNGAEAVGAAAADGVLAGLRQAGVR